MGRADFRTVGFISDCNFVNKNISIRGKIGSWSRFVFKDFNYIIKLVSIFINVMNFKVCHLLKNVGFKFNLRSSYQKYILFCVKRTKTFCESNTKMHKSKRNFCEKKGWEYHITVICVTDTYSFWKQSKINYDEL